MNDRVGLALLDRPRDRVRLTHVGAHPSHCPSLVATEERGAGEARSEPRQVYSIAGGEQRLCQPLPHEPVAAGDEDAPHQARARSRSRSAATIIRTSSSNETFGVQPSLRAALDGSATSRSTSAGRRKRGSWTTNSR